MWVLKRKRANYASNDRSTHRSLILPRKFVAYFPFPLFSRYMNCSTTHHCSCGRKKKWSGRETKWRNRLYCVSRRKSGHPVGAARYVTMHRMCTNKGICPRRLIVGWNICDAKNGGTRKPGCIPRACASKIEKGPERSIHLGGVGMVHMDREGSFNGCESDVSLCAAFFSHLDQCGSAPLHFASLGRAIEQKYYLSPYSSCVQNSRITYASCDD